MTKERSLNYGRHIIDEDDIAAVVEVLRGDLITQGPLVEQFEMALADRVNAKYAVAVTSGTAGLHIACLAAGLKPGKTGITSAMTFAASANAMNYCGAEVRLCDIDADTLCMDSNHLKELLEEQPDTDVVMPVHFSGLSADMEKIREYAGDRLIIEDAAHALGANYKCGRPVGCGAYSEMTVFSFHPVKPITTGEGGAVVTNDPKLAHLLRLFRTHGIEKELNNFINTDAQGDDGSQLPWYYEQQFLGYNYRLTDIQASLGLSQLPKLAKFIGMRREIAKKYDEAFSNLPHINLPQATIENRKRNGQHLYIIKVDFDEIKTTRDTFFKKLLDFNVGSQVHYIPIYHHPYHAKRIGAKKESFPATESYYQRCLSLPIFPSMTDDETTRVIKAVKSLVKR